MTTIIIISIAATMIVASKIVDAVLESTVEKEKTKQLEYKARIKESDNQQKILKKFDSVDLDNPEQVNLYTELFSKNL